MSSFLRVFWSLDSFQVGVLTSKYAVTPVIFKGITIGWVALKGFSYMECVILLEMGARNFWTSSIRTPFSWENNGDDQVPSPQSPDLLRR